MFPCTWFVLVFMACKHDTSPKSWKRIHDLLSHPTGQSCIFWVLGCSCWPLSPFPKACCLDPWLGACHLPMKVFPNNLPCCSAATAFGKACQKPVAQQGAGTRYIGELFHNQYKPPQRKKPYTYMICVCERHVIRCDEEIMFLK